MVIYNNIYNYIYIYIYKICLIYIYIYICSSCGCLETKKMLELDIGEAKPYNVLDFVA